MIEPIEGVRTVFGSSIGYRRANKLIPRLFEEGLLSKKFVPEIFVVADDVTASIAQGIHELRSGAYVVVLGAGRRARWDLELLLPERSALESRADLCVCDARCFASSLKLEGVPHQRVIVVPDADSKPAALGNVKTFASGAGWRNQINSALRSRFKVLDIEWDSSQSASFDDVTLSDEDILTLLESEIVVTDNPTVARLVSSGNSIVIYFGLEPPCRDLISSKKIAATNPDQIEEMILTLDPLTSSAQVPPSAGDQRATEDSDLTNGRFRHLRATPMELPPPSKPRDFSLDEYSKIIETFVSRGYVIEPFLGKKSLQPTVFLRHDVDMSLGQAARLAEFESTMGVSSSYFILIRSEFYNVMSVESRRYIDNICSLGHHVGLHYDMVASGASSIDEAVLQIPDEVALLSRMTGVQVEAVSFHRPIEEVLTVDISDRVGIPSAYDRRFRDGTDAWYVSDSGCRWFENVGPLDLDAVTSRMSIQLLTHPVWWVNGPCDPFDALNSVLTERMKVAEVAMAENSRIFRVGLHSFVEG